MSPKAALIEQQKEGKAAREEWCCLRRNGSPVCIRTSSSSEACMPWPDALIAEEECLHSQTDTADILRSSSSRSRDKSFLGKLAANAESTVIPAQQAAEAMRPSHHCLLRRLVSTGWPGHGTADNLSVGHAMNVDPTAEGVKRHDEYGQATNGHIMSRSLCNVHGFAFSHRDHCSRRASLPIPLLGHQSLGMSCA